MDLNLAKQAQTQAFEHLSNLIQGISSPVRLKLLFFLSHGAQTVEVLAEKIEQSTANTSMHLRKMHQLGLVQAKPEGIKRRYSLTNESLHQLWESIQYFGLSIDQKIPQAFQESEKLEFNRSLSDLIQTLKKKNHVLVDLRPIDERERTLFHHCLFIEDLKNPNPKMTYYLLCRGKYCALSTSWVSLLHKKNIKAYKIPFSAYQIEQYYQSKGDLT
jgi:ArsR family transcriptional regulator, nickel/cobalt-responsive transcriptional repressor